MKTFKQLREQKVSSKKMNGIPYSIAKTPKGFVVTIDGDKLDTFKDEKTALDTVKMVISTLKK
jgi:hypothetical protein